MINVVSGHSQGGYRQHTRPALSSKATNFPSSNPLIFSLSEHYCTTMFFSHGLRWRKKKRKAPHTWDLLKSREGTNAYMCTYTPHSMTEHESVSYEDCSIKAEKLSIVINRKCCVENVSEECAGISHFANFTLQYEKMLGGKNWMWIIASHIFISSDCLGAKIDTAIRSRLIFFSIL